MLNIPLPPSAKKERLYSRIELDSGQTSFELFPKNPSGGDASQNYEQIPLATDLYTLFLGLSVAPTLTIIEEDANIDPMKVVNCLTSGVFKVTTNQNRLTELRYPTKDVFNFNNMSSAIAFNSTDVRTTSYTLGSAGRRPVDQLFYLTPNESWGASLELTSADLPAKADWPDQALGVYTEIYVAQMDKSSLQDYADQLVQRSGYSGDYQSVTIK